jgi:hypothetical protein
VAIDPQASHTELLLGGAVPASNGAYGAVTRAGARPEGAHAIAQDQRKESVTTNLARRLPNPVSLMVRIPMSPLHFALVLIEIHAPEWSGTFLQWAAAQAPPRPALRHHLPKGRCSLLYVL